MLRNSLVIVVLVSNTLLAASQTVEEEILELRARLDALEQTQDSRFRVVDDRFVPESLEAGPSGQETDPKANKSAQSDQATSAEHATQADHSTEADHATEADHTIQADTSVSSVTATHALTANTAANASSLQGNVIGASSGNVPINNGTKMDNLYATFADKAKTSLGDLRYYGGNTSGWLDFDGITANDRALYFCQGSSYAYVFRVVRSGSFYDVMRLTDTGHLYISGTLHTSADIGETFPSTDMSLSAGDVVQPSTTGVPFRPHPRASVEKAVLGTQPIIGVVSTNPGFVGTLPDEDNGQFTEGEGDPYLKVVGLLGQLPVKVMVLDAITEGDLITASPMPGYGMTTDQESSQKVGIALESTETWREENISVVTTLEEIQWPTDVHGTNRMQPVYRVPVTALPKDAQVGLNAIQPAVESVLLGKIIVLVKPGL